MEKKMNNEELQTRREFFKNAAKGALPILGLVAFSNIPLFIKAKEAAPMGCNYLCMDSCSTSCSGNCKFTCQDSCSGTCKNSCSGACTNSCYRGCLQTCSGTCSGGCAQSAYA